MGYCYNNYPEVKNIIKSEICILHSYIKNEIYALKTIIQIYYDIFSKLNLICY